jgi:archaellum component FlaC
MEKEKIKKLVSKLVEEYEKAVNDYNKPFRDEGEYAYLNGRIDGIEDCIGKLRNELEE